MAYDENTALAEECREIIQQNIPPKLTGLCRFTIPCSIGSITIGHALCGLGAIINLMPLSMMRKLKYGETKPTRMTLTLADHSITYQYGVLEDVLVRVNDLLFPTDFVITDMPEDFKSPLLLGRPLLTTNRALIDVEMGELILRFNKDHVGLKMFESMKHKKEKPQCYKVDIVEDVVEEMSQNEAHLLPIEYLW